MKSILLKLRELASGLKSKKCVIAPSPNLNETVEDESSVFFTVDGKEYCDEEKALSKLLAADVLFCNDREFTYNNKVEGRTIVLFVNCNDLFWWACADAENLEMSEIPVLYKLWKADPDYGVWKWCCLKRKMRPQAPAEKMMREAGAWDDALEALPYRDPKDCG